MDHRVTRIGAVIALALGLGACQTSGARRSLSKGEQLLAKDRGEEAVEHFDRAQASSSDPLESARAFLGLGQAQLKLGEKRQAQNSLYKARSELQKAEKGTRRGGTRRDSAARRREKESLATQIDRWIGEAYLDGGQFELAGRYLLGALPGLEGPDRESVLAELAFLSREAGDTSGASRYQRQLTRPYSGDVAGILDGHSPRLVEARKARHAGEPESPPRAATRTDVTRSAPERSEPVRRSATRRSSPEAPARILDRGDWDARAPMASRLRPMGTISRITVHHSAGQSFWAYSQEDTATHIRSIQRYHQDERKWADIGYHYIIDRAGNIWEGRSRQWQGAHAGGQANRGNIGIVVLGNYARQGLNREQVRSLANLVGQLSDRYGVPHYRVYTHKEIQPGHNTACPGPALTRVVGQIRGKLRERHLAMGK